MILTPNFHFNGQCEEALAAYEKAFGTKAAFCLRYADADVRDLSVPLAPEQLRYIYHAEMAIGGHRCFFSDSLQPVPAGTHLSVVVTFEHPEEVQRAYAVLAEGGRAITPPRQTTYSSCFTSLVDRFGIRWELMTETGG